MSNRTLTLGVLIAVLAAGPAFARCGDQPGDSAAVAAIRARAEMQCDCATAFDHAIYVRCVRAVAEIAVERGELSPACRGAVAKCASKSTCARPGAVVCRRTTSAGRSKCRIKRDATRCRGASGTSACVVGGVASCCDATSCDAATSTTQPTTTTVAGASTTTTTTTLGAGTTTTSTTLGGSQDQLVFTTAPGTTDCGAAGLASPPAPPYSGELDSDT